MPDVTRAFHLSSTQIPARPPPTCEGALPRLGLCLEHQLPSEHVKGAVALAVPTVVPAGSERREGKQAGRHVRQNIAAGEAGGT
jgi:hypothetical protein